MKNSHNWLLISMVHLVKNVFIIKILYLCDCFMKILKTYKFKKQVNVNQRALGCLVTAKFFLLLFSSRAFSYLCNDRGILNAVVVSKDGLLVLSAVFESSKDTERRAANFEFI